MEPYDDVVRQYTHFAEEAREESPCFVEWGLGVAGDPEVLAWVDELPGVKKQPNLVFAAARFHGVPAPGPYAGLRDALLGDDGTIRATIMAHVDADQRGRTAGHPPARVGAGGPGGAAGPDRGRRQRRAQPLSRPLGLRVDHPGRRSHVPWVRSRGSAAGWLGRPPLPMARPEIAWRGGVDLNPLDVTDADDDGLAGDAGLAGAGRPARAAAARRSTSRAPTRRVIVRGDLLERAPAAGGRGRGARHGGGLPQRRSRRTCPGRTAPPATS